MTSDVWQEYFKLDMSSLNDEARDSGAVLVTAAVQQTSVETAWRRLECAPSANTVRHTVKARLMDDEQLVRLEATVNELLGASCRTGC